MATISYTLDVETSKGFKKVLDLHNQATSLFNRGVTLRLNNQFSGPLGKITGDVKQFDQSLNAATARVLAFTSTTSILYSVGAAMRRLVTDAVNVEAALKGIQAISSTSDSTMKAFGASLFDVANKTSQSFYDVASAAEEFSRQGLTVAESLKAVTAASNLARLSGTNLKDSIGGLVSIISTFSSQALEYADVVNTLASVDAQFATSAAGLVDGLKRVGGVAEEAGLSLQKTTALIASIKQLTGRSEAVIGNGLKSIITNLQTESVQKALEGIGIQTKNVNGEFRDLIDVFREYAAVSEKLDPQRKANVEQKIAGKYQINNFQGLVKSFGGNKDGQSIFEKASLAANPDEDLTQRRIDLLNSTTKTAEQRLQNKITALGAGVGSEVLKPAFDKTIEFVDKIISSISSISTTIGPILKGISDVLSGPVLLTAGVAILNLFVKLSKEVGGAVASILKFGTGEQEVLTIQNAINNALKNGNQQLIEQVRNATTLADRTSAINALLRDNLSLRRATQGNQFLDVSLVNQANRKAIIKNKASGYIPPGFEDAFSREDAQIKAGVGGASRHARPLLKSLNLSGSSERVVVNSDEVIVRNFMGTGRDSVLNKNMLKRVGDRVGSLGQIETLADGSVPPLPVGIDNNRFFGNRIIDVKDAKDLLRKTQELLNARNTKSNFIDRLALRKALDALPKSARAIVSGAASPNFNSGLKNAGGVPLGQINRDLIQAVVSRSQEEKNVLKTQLAQNEAQRKNIQLQKLEATQAQITTEKLSAKLGGGFLSANRIGEIINQNAGGSSRDAKFLNQKIGNSERYSSLEKESEKFKRLIEQNRASLSAEGKILGHSDISKLYKNFNFSGTTSEKQTFLKEVAKEAKQQSTQERKIFIRAIRENNPARAEIQLNKFIGDKDTAPKGLIESIKRSLGFGRLSAGDISTEAGSISRKLRLTPTQNGQFLTNTQQILNQRETERAAASQGRVFAASFAVPLLSGYFSKKAEEKFITADNTEAYRETGSSRAISDVGGSLSTGLSTSFLLNSITGGKGFLSKASGPIAIGLAAKGIADAISKYQFGNADLSVEKGKEEAAKYNKSTSETNKYFDIKDNIKNTIREGGSSLAINKLLKELRIQSHSLSKDDLSVINSARSEKDLSSVRETINDRNRRNSDISSFEGEARTIVSQAFDKISEGGLADNIGGYILQKSLSFGELFGKKANLDSFGTIDNTQLGTSFEKLGLNVNPSLLVDSKGNKTDLFKRATSSNVQNIGDIYNIADELGLGAAKKGLQDINSKSGANGSSSQTIAALYFRNALKNIVSTEEDSKKELKPYNVEELKRINETLKKGFDKDEISKLKRETAISSSQERSYNSLNFRKSTNDIGDNEFNVEEFKLKSEKLQEENAEYERTLRAKTEQEIINLIKSPNAIPLENLVPTLQYVNDVKASGGNLEGDREKSFIEYIAGKGSGLSEEFQKALSNIFKSTSQEREKYNITANQSKGDLSFNNDLIQRTQKFKERQEREKQILGFGADNTRYNPATALGLSSATAASALANSIYTDKTQEAKTKFGIPLTPDDIRGQTLRTGAFSRGQIDSFKTSLQSDPNLVDLPDAATDEERRSQAVYKSKKRNELEGLIGNSYKEISNTDSIGKIRGEYSQFGLIKGLQGNFGGQEEKRIVADALKTGDYSAAREKIQSQKDYVDSDEFLRQNTKENQVKLSRSYEAIQQSLGDSPKSESIYKEKAKLEAEQAIPKNPGEDKLVESMNQLAEVFKTNKSESGKTSSEINSTVNVNVAGPPDQSQQNELLHKYIMDTVVSALKVYTTDNNKNPVIIPPSSSVIQKGGKTTLEGSDSPLY
jgi:TP901 family phage tail tape measure protein